MALLFWPLMIASIILAVVGIMKKQALYLVGATIAILPFSLYIAATPLFRGWGLLLPFCYLGAALLLKRQAILVASILVLPVVGTVSWMGYQVITQV